MTIFLKENQFEQKVKGEIKFVPDNRFLFDFKEGWNTIIINIMFPLSDDLTLESAFKIYAEYYLNPKGSVNKIKLKDVRNIEIIDNNSN